MQLRIFSDFDGTIAINDVGDQLFIRFGDEQSWWHLVGQWRDKKIDGRQLWRRQCEITRITPTEMDQFASEQDIDASFAPFVDFCREKQYPLYVLSDGMDAYIRRILANHGIFQVDIRANHLEIAADGRLSVSFPYFAEGCGQCANCKGAHIRQQRRPGEIAVYIGDGYSDLCAIQAADMLFAKDELAEHCRRHGIRFHPYRTFADVQQQLQQLSAG